MYWRELFQKRGIQTEIVNEGIFVGAKRVQAFGISSVYLYVWPNALTDRHAFLHVAPYYLAERLKYTVFPFLTI